MCDLLYISRSGYYAWRSRPTSQREMANKQLLDKIKVVYEVNRGCYGSPRIYHEIKDEIPCSLNRVARLMQQHGIRAKQAKRYKTTTQQNENHPHAPNHLAQDFHASQPAEKWCGDIILRQAQDRLYVWTAAGWLYLVVVIDLYSRRVIGWAMNARMTTQLVKDAFQMAWRQQKPKPGLLFHSDRGSQYTSHEFQRLLQFYHVKASMSGTGNCYDNAVVESFFSSLKMELIYQTVYFNREEATTDIFFYIEGFYNRQRRHSALGYVSPQAYEAIYQQQALAI